MLTQMKKTDRQRGFRASNYMNEAKNYLLNFNADTDMKTNKNDLVI